MLFPVLFFRLFSTFFFIQYAYKGWVPGGIRIAARRTNQLATPHPN